MQHFPDTMAPYKSITESMSQTSQSPHTKASRSSQQQTTSLRTAQSTGRFGKRPPPVVPLYQLDKYMVKPSVELKKKRFRRFIEEEISASEAMQSASKLKRIGSALALRKA